MSTRFMSAFSVERFANSFAYPRVPTVTITSLSVPFLLVEFSHGLAADIFVCFLFELFLIYFFIHILY